MAKQQIAHARKLIEQGEGAHDVARSFNASRRKLCGALKADTQ
jgi:DNA-binding phage protein